MKRAILFVLCAIGAARILFVASPAVAPYDWSRYSVLTPAGPEEPEPEVLRRLHRLAWAEHRLSRGEQTASALAKKYGTTAASLQATNNDELYILSVGKKLTIPNKTGQLYEVKKSSEALDQIVRKFSRNPKEALVFKQTLVYANKLPGSAMLSGYELPKGARLLITKFSVPNFDSYHMPLVGGRISSGFGLRYHPVLGRRRMHDGLDIAKPWGSSVYAARSGTVMETGWVEGYGLLITLRHSDGWTTRYGHLSKILIKSGQKVQRGTLIGKVGSTGLSTGPHLHFEVRNRDGKPVNPGAKIGRR